MKTLSSEGFRFCASPDRSEYRWIHWLEIGRYPGWIDCTDMDDAQFAAFVTGA